jgi:hypothetical protein
MKDAFTASSEGIEVAQLACAQNLVGEVHAQILGLHGREKVAAKRDLSRTKGPGRVRF